MPQFIDIGRDPRYMKANTLEIALADYDDLIDDFECDEWDQLTFQKLARTFWTKRKRILGICVCSAFPYPHAAALSSKCAETHFLIASALKEKFENEGPI